MIYDKEKKEIDDLIQEYKEAVAELKKNEAKQSKLEESLELDLQLEKRGCVIPTIVQDYNTGQILMLAYSNMTALKNTLTTNMATFWSTSRNALWQKGTDSGNYLPIKGIYIDCDQDAILYLVDSKGKQACHTRMQNNLQRKTCFYRKILNEKTLEFCEQETLLNSFELNELKGMKNENRTS